MQEEMDLDKREREVLDGDKEKESEKTGNVKSEKENGGSVEDEKKKESEIVEKEKEACVGENKETNAKEERKESKTERNEDIGEEKKMEAETEEMKKATEEHNKEDETNADEKKMEAQMKENDAEVVMEENTKAREMGKNENEANVEEKGNENEEKTKEVEIEETTKTTETDEKENGVNTEENKKETEMEEEKRETEMEEKKMEPETKEKKDKEAEAGEIKEGERHCLYDLKENEKKALFEFRSKLEEAILEDRIFKKNKDDTATDQEAREKQEGRSENQEPEGKQGEEGKEEKPEKEDNQHLEEKKKLEEEETEKDKKFAEQEPSMEINKDISLWGVPLLPSKQDEATDTVLLKFLRARDFRVNDALEMLKNTLQWRRENKIDSITDEDFGEEFSRFAFMGGEDREGQPVCYNVFGVFGEDETFERLMSTEEKRNRFLRWRVQLMERGIKKLDLRPGGVSSMLQINDLSNTPLPSKKELRVAVKQAVTVLLDNYPEFVSRNVFINVPFWYYAFTAILSPFLTQRTRSKFVFARPAKANETLFKYVSGERIPVQFGGLKRENDSEFSVEDTAMEVMIKSGSAETIEIPAPEVGRTLRWDMSVSGGEVNYREEFVPTDEKSYTIIVKKNTKIGLQEGSVRNCFKNSEPGKIVLFIENTSFKKKRVLYRCKIID